MKKLTVIAICLIMFVIAFSIPYYAYACGPGDGGTSDTGNDNDSGGDQGDNGGKGDNGMGNDSSNGDDSSQSSDQSGEHNESTYDRNVSDCNNPYFNIRCNPHVKATF